MPIPASSPTACGSRITSILRRRSYGSQSRRGLGDQHPLPWTKVGSINDAAYLTQLTPEATDAVAHRHRAALFGSKKMRGIDGVADLAAHEVERFGEKSDIDIGGMAL